MNIIYVDKGTKSKELEALFKKTGLPYVLSTDYGDLQKNYIYELPVLKLDIGFSYTYDEAVKFIEEFEIEKRLRKC